LIADDGHLKVIDFGVAKALSGRFMTNTGMIKGKLGYMSVEALGGKDLDSRTDIFSAGVVMWEMLAGRRLFTGKDELSVIQQVRTATIPRPSLFNMNCPLELDEIVMKALQRYRDERWDTAAAMRFALDEVRRYYGDHATPLGVSRWKRKLRRESSVRHQQDEEVTSERVAALSGAYEEFELEEEVSRRDLFDVESVITDPHSDFHEVTQDEIGIKIFFNQDADNTEREK
jgi:serine/threonine-protein kinase